MTAALPRLLFGPYAAPRFRVGGKLFDESLGWVTVGGIRDAPVPWPYRKARGRHRLILTGDLCRAVRTEAACVVAAWWDVAGTTVWKWKVALAVPHATPGTRERIAAPKRGVSRPAHVIAAMHRKGAKHTAESRAKMSAERKARRCRPPWIGPPWTAREDRILLANDPPTVARKTGRTLALGRRLTSRP